MDTFAGRVLRAARLDPDLYDEVGTDQKAFKQAAGLVILSSIAGGLGTLAPHTGFVGLLGGTFAALLGWMVWASLVYFVGVKWMGGPMSYSDTGELLRAAGFASAPGLIRIMGIFPSSSVKTIVFFISLVWMLIAMAIAVRQALDYSSTGQALMVSAIGWFFQIIVVLTILWASGVLFLPS